ncbi:MAG: hypothetical protein MUE60_04990 [Candidatus Eisenbacteria bacterium]|nr:hypothetical protein [Candidatus Eisenbacteria bacterium]
MALTTRAPFALAGALVLATLGAAVAGVMALSVPCPWGAGRCLLPSDPAALPTLRWSVALVALLHGLVIPGWLLGTVLRIPPPIRLGFALPLSGVIWAVSRTVLHVMGVPPSALAAALSLAAVDALLLASCRDGIRLRPSRGEALAALAGVAVLMVIGPARIALQSLDGDGVEALSFAASLDHRLLPMWDLENGTWGFYPAFMSFAYPLHLSLSLLGESEAAARLPLVPLTAGLAALVASEHRGLLRGGFMLAAVVVAATSGLNYTYEPYAADITEPTVTDLFFTAGLLSMLWAWFQRRLGLFALMAAVVVTGQPAGLPFALVLVAGGLLRRDTRAFSLRAAGILAAVLLARTAADRGYNPAGATKFSAATFFAHHAGALSRHLGARTAATQIWALLIQTSGAPLVFAAAFARDVRHTKSRTAVYCALAVYVLAVTLSPKRHPHYLTPIAAMILFLVPSGVSLPRLWPLMVAGVLLGVLPPKGCPIDTRAAEFGRATCTVFPSMREATENADLLYRVLTVPPWRDHEQWGMGKHAWVLYSTRAETLPLRPPAGVHVLFTHEPRSWEGFVPVTDNGRGYVYESPAGWMESWKAQGGTTRCWGALLKVPALLWDPIARWKP